jgi:hypothetical protein
VDGEEQQGGPQNPPADSAPADPPRPQDSTPPDDSGKLPDFDLEWDFRGGEPPGLKRRISEVDSKGGSEPKD